MIGKVVEIKNNQIIIENINYEKQGFTLENNSSDALNVNVDECIKRDPKGLYKSNINQIIESSKEYEVPTNNEITLNTNLYKPYECSMIVFNYLKINKLIL